MSIHRNAELFPIHPRMQMEEAINLTVDSLNTYASNHPHWCVAWSGGKDSTATLTLLLHLLDTGRIARPVSLTVIYADTRQELPPLSIAAYQIIQKLKHLDIRTAIAVAPIDKRFLVYILGRGVPPPNNNTLRWCTKQIKVEPMIKVIESIIPDDGSTILTITGVRIGESAVMDRRIEMSCSKNGAECGQGWYQNVMPNSSGIRGKIATLAPLIHWRVCHVWDWLRFYAPGQGWPTRLIAEAYGGDEAEEKNTRTGCIGCPLVQKETALDGILKLDDWKYLTPLRGLKPIYRELRKPENRLKKTGELLKSGILSSSPQRMGPLTYESRLWGLQEILKIQNEINEAAVRLNRPLFDILNNEEESRIRELISDKTWPNGWDGTEPIAIIPQPIIYRDGSIQPDLFIV